MSIEVRRILVPVDFSEHTPGVLEWGIHLAQEHDSSILLLHAYHLPVEFQQLEGAYLPPDFWSSVKAGAESQLEALAEEIRTAGVTVETAAVEGYAASAIVEQAGLREADLIVIGTHGLSGLKHLLLGSTAERVVQKAPCPVLTVKTPSA